jgi:peptide subunit release factor 1 (eRF1)
VSRSGVRCFEAVTQTALSVQRAARSSVLALCERLDGDDGEAIYAGGRASFTTRPETVEVEPPFRLAFEGRFEPCSTAPLAEHLRLPRRVGLLWVRLGGYAAAVYEDEQLIDGRAGARFVKNRNKKGGSSSNRFRRRRSEQARDLHDRAAELADELLAPWQAGLDWLVIAGDRLAIAAVEERSLVLPRIEAPREVARFHLGDPRSSLLEGVARELWSSTIRRPGLPQRGG